MSAMFDLFQICLPRNTTLVARRKIIHDDDVRSLCDKAVDDVRADEARSTGYYGCSLASTDRVILRRS